MICFYKILSDKLNFSEGEIITTKNNLKNNKMLIDKDYIFNNSLYEKIESQLLNIFGELDGKN